MTNEKKLIALNKIAKTLDIYEGNINAYAEAIEDMSKQLQKLADDLQNILKEE